MLTQDVLHAVSNYAEHSLTSGLTPIPGTALSTLTTALIDKTNVLSSSVSDDADGESSGSSVIDLIHQASCDNSDHVAAHERVIDKAVTDVTRVMRSNIYLARTTVLPLLDKYTTELVDTVAKRSSPAALALAVTPDNKRVILSSGQLKSIVASNAGRTVYEGIVLPRYHSGTPSTTELTTLIVTGNQVFDEGIARWIKVNGLADTLGTTYTNIFLKGNTSVEVTRYLNDKNYEVSILALLLCWGLVKNIGDDIEIGLEEYRTRMEMFAGACCGMISQSIRRYESGIKFKGLVVEYPEPNREHNYNDISRNNIVVDPETYDYFLAKGGTPEMVMGAYLTDRTFNADAILLSAENYVKQYERTLARGRLAAMNDTLTIVKSTMQSMLTRIVADVINTNSDVVSDENAATRMAISFTGNEHMIHARQFINTIGMREISDYYGLMRRFICGCFFKGSMVEHLLNKIDVLDPTGENDINEMALVATTDLIVDWFAEQITKDKSDISLEGFYKL